MVEDVVKDEAIEIAKAYADKECVGELGEILDTQEAGSNWIVAFRTYTFSDTYDHRVKITASVANGISHERKC